MKSFKISLSVALSLVLFNGQATPGDKTASTHRKKYEATAKKYLPEQAVVTEIPALPTGFPAYHTTEYSPEQMAAIIGLSFKKR